MKTALRFPKFLIVIVTCSALFSFQPQFSAEKINMPWKKAGLTERQAAAHLLSRFTFGARPGDVDEVLKKGLDKWLLEQLQGNVADDTLEQRLSGYEALKLTNAEVVAQYPVGGKLLKMAIDDGVIDKDSVDKSDKDAYKDKLEAYRIQKGYKLPRELFRQFANQKILRAAYSNNQLKEMMTEFWFNHFNVSMTKNDCRLFIPAYERDVIRTRALGNFEDLLIATAKSPAMLFYLDNFSSAGTNESIDMDMDGRKQKKFAAGLKRIMMDSSRPMLEKIKQRKKNQGLNENYAREVMELHTLGVDGGYTQQDVTNAARVLTGWSVYPMSDYGPGANLKKIIEKVGQDKLAERGFVREGDFFFAANRHDDGEKTVLGKSFPAGGGYDEGVQLLKMLSHHPSTAKFISRKLAVRFVSDNPPQSLVDKMAKTFTEKNGDIKEVLITLVSSPEFWAKESLREKTKSPFELAISTVRSLNAEIKMPYQLYNWVSKMGQKMYSYQAPTGFPDRGQYWINSGALLNRMSFGLAIASQKIPGTKINLLALNKGHEPESAEDALVTFSRLMLPERDLTETIRRLTPLLNNPELQQKVEKAADKTAEKNTVMSAQVKMTEQSEHEMGAALPIKKDTGKAGNTEKKGDNMMAQIVGIIIGSPEFQRK